MHFKYSAHELQDGVSPQRHFPTMGIRVSKCRFGVQADSLSCSAARSASPAAGR